MAMVEAAQQGAGVTAMTAPPQADLSDLPAAGADREDDGSDKTLAARAAAGDPGAFDALVVLFNNRVFGVAFRILGDRAEAEDLAQEVFVTLYHSLGSFRGESKLSTWIYRITRNRCLNRIKFLKRRHVGRHADIDDPSVSPATIDLETRSSGAKDPVRKLANDELSDLLQEHLLKLPEEQRTLVVLRDLEDLSYEEIVEVTGLALGTVKSRLHRARAALARSLQSHRAALEPHL
jgi:RNA polymerase sigma-70 factor (ECF subfamily)